VSFIADLIMQITTIYIFGLFVGNFS